MGRIQAFLDRICFLLWLRTMDYRLQTLSLLFPYHLLAFRRLTPTTMRSTRQVLVSSCLAATEGVRPRRATRFQTVNA